MPLIDAVNYDVMAREKLCQIIDDLVTRGQMVDTAGEDLLLYLNHFGIVDGTFALISVPDQFRFEDGLLVPGMAAEYAVRQILSTRPHWQPKVVTDDEELAFGENPTLKARAAYLKEHGEGAYLRAMRDWGASPRNLNPGTRPADGTDKTTKRPGLQNSGKDNPWARLRDVKTGKIDPAAQARCTDIITRLGPAVAARMAKAAGMTIGGSPLRK